MFYAERDKDGKIIAIHKNKQSGREDLTPVTGQELQEFLASDHQQGTYELSWTVSPHARGKNIGKNLVAQIASRIRSPIKAIIQKDNIASIKIAKHVGMSLKFEEDGIMHWLREKLDG